MKTKKILIVDDDPCIRLIINNILKDDFETELKENAFDALTYMQEGNIPDAILSDIKMPEMSGEELLSTIKSSSVLKDIPFIFLSGVDDSHERVICLKNGADDYLIKPFNPEELQIRILKLFKSNNNV